MNPLNNPFTPEHKLPKKRLFGGDKQERALFAHLEESEEGEFENKIEHARFDFLGFQLNHRCFTFMKSLSKQIKDSQDEYIQSGGFVPTPWTQERIQEKLINRLGIADIEHGQITSINVSQLGLMTLPDLPDGLEVLNCNSNILTAMPDLPQSLQILICSHNYLADLPELPPHLVKLFCDDNQLYSLPHLPKFLQVLHCNNNPLSPEEKGKISDAFPGHLGDLNI